MGVEVSVEGLTKSFGVQKIWQDVTLTLPTGEVSALLGPSGTGKSVFLKSLIGLLRPEEGRIVVDGTDIMECSSKELYEIRKLFGVLFQDGALFGSMNLYDNTAFPLREHTKKKEDEIRKIVMEKLELVGLTGAENKLPGEISGGMRKRAGLARALVLDPEIILVDEPDSGLDPVRTTYISQLLLNINAQIDATMLIVTHNINLARTVPDNIGMLFRKNLVMFGPREVLLTSDEPAVKQFLNGTMIGPIGMSEEKDEAQMRQEQALSDAGHNLGGVEDVEGIMPQMDPTPGMPRRQAVDRRRERVRSIMHTLPESAQQAIQQSFDEAEAEDGRSPAYAGATERSGYGNDDQGYQQGGYDQGYQQGGYDQGYQQGGYQQDGYQQAGYDQGQQQGGWSSDDRPTEQNEFRQGVDGGERRADQGGYQGWNEPEPRDRYDSPTDRPRG
ncbi:ABC transporter ATP-binding protein [Rhodococcoides corynebacterioides]|uniref:ABC transporter ATP-binding protein n=1 Tax=Rhodococcoides corynebacterioides TaxID=53972 RepID=UPI0027E1EA04|nr:ABC transporter ATP-binding protein [Rhodococcus corynebacterioides]